MKNIYTFALESAVKSNSINFDAFIKVLEDMTTSQMIRVIEAVIGCVDVDSMKASIPMRSKVGRDHSAATFKAYNYFTDKVDYDYDYTEVKYFATPEEAEKYTSTGKYSWDKYKSRQDGEYVFAGTWTSKENSSCDLDYWMNNAIEEEA